MIGFFNQAATYENTSISGRIFSSQSFWPGWHEGGVGSKTILGRQLSFGKAFRSEMITATFSGE